MDKFAVLNRYYVTIFTYLLNKLKTTPDGDGTLLDHSMVLTAARMGRRESAQSRATSDHLAGSGIGQAERRTAYPESEGYDDVEPAGGNAEQAQRAGDEVRGQYQEYWRSSEGEGNFFYPSPDPSGRPLPSGEG